MSDETEYAEQDQDEFYADPKAVKSLREANKQMKADLEAARAQAEQATQATRELAFIKAGIDIESPTGKLFAKAYDGEATPDAIKEAAEEYGLAAPKPQPSAALAQQQQMSQAVAGAGEAPANESVNARIAAAQTQEEVMAILASAGVPTSYEQVGAPVPWNELPG